MAERQFHDTTLYLNFLVVPGLTAAFVISGTGSIEAQRWYFPHNYLGNRPWQMFTISGTVNVGLALLMIGIAVLGSLVIKKPTAVIITTAVLFGVVVFTVSSTYPTLLTPKTLMQPGFSYEVPTGSLEIKAVNVNSSGTRLSNSKMSAISQICNKDLIAGMQFQSSYGSTGGNVPPQNRYLNCFLAQGFTH